MKLKLGADQAFFESPKRETVMLFSIVIAVLVRRMMQLLTRKEYGKGFGVPQEHNRMSYVRHDSEYVRSFGQGCGTDLS